MRSRSRALPNGVDLRDVGEHRLKGLDLPERLFQLTIDGLPNDFPPLQTVDMSRAHVPPRMTTFVGRRADLDELHRLLQAHRLVTLVGPGGTGKTSLAIEMAGEVANEFVDGAWFVDLAPLSDPALVGPTVARELGLNERADRSLVELLRTYLETREMLLMLDNFEHLLGATETVEDILAVAPGLKVLVTSRTILNLYGEQEFPVPPLTMPEVGRADRPGGARVLRGGGALPAAGTGRQAGVLDHERERPDYHADLYTARRPAARDRVGRQPHKGPGAGRDPGAVGTTSPGADRRGKQPACPTANPARCDRLELRPP